ncbi:uncharacterized protein LOC128093613 [Culex pipiens pallens]|uniref:uncharacterized protein LOC128093613 n=1 Tax=Culex pipiens pallens TaxID=42434 RepID=UPI0022AABCEB|nr:uncharacterized protein LOC128093613 [Culex pipiens pallens]
MNQTTALLLLLLILAGAFFTGSEAQITSNFFPASEYTFGTYTPVLTPCFSSNVNRYAFSLFPTMQTFMFTPATAIRYIRIWSENLVPFYANVLTGGVGTAVATAIQVSSVHGGRLQANIQAYCV